MSPQAYHIRNMTREEVNIAIAWAGREGWNPGLHDGDSYYHADPTGFFIGLLDQQPIATISAVKYGSTFGFIGFYIVRPEHRGKGYGIQLWDYAIRSLEGRNIGLDGVVAQQDNYAKSGFHFSYRNIRYRGVGGGQVSQHPHIIPLGTLPFESIVSYDREFFPADRSHFLQSWINQPQCHALGIMHNGAIAGYGVIRICGSGYKIGPLFADSFEQAEALFLALKSTASASDPLFLDIPEGNPHGQAMAEKYQMQVCFETARMYTQDPPPTPLHRLYGVTSFEIG